MATLKWDGWEGFSFKLFNLYNIRYGWNYDRTPTLFGVDYDGGAREEFRGSGFVYGSKGVPIGGNLKTYTLYEYDGTKQGTISGLKVSVAKLSAAAATKTTSDDIRLFKSVLSGDDALTGGGDNDRLEGFSGNDLIYGRGGADKLYGGKGKDIFVFKKVSDSQADSSFYDTIYDFSRSQKDRIDLRSIDSEFSKKGNQAFHFIGSKQLSGVAGELRFQKVSGGLKIYGDTDGDGYADLMISVKGLSSMIKSDFYL